MSGVGISHNTFCWTVCNVFILSLDGITAAQYPEIIPITVAFNVGLSLLMIFSVSIFYNKASLASFFKSPSFKQEIGLSSSS